VEPVEIGRAGGFDREDEELGSLVSVEGVEAGFEGGELGGGSFEQEQSFGGGFNLALPPVDGLCGGQEGGAGGQAFFDQRAGELGGGFGGVVGG